MRLPPLDAIRLPLVEPLGHLALQAAFFDNALIEFVAMLRPDLSVEQVAHEMRNWKIEFLQSAIDEGIESEPIALDLASFFARIAVLREDRHRLIHDMMGVGIEGDPTAGYRAVLLREGYVREPRTRTTRKQVASVTADQIAATACRYYDARLEIDTFLGRLYDAGGITRA